MRTSYDGGDPAEDHVTFWFWVVALLGLIWLGCLVWLVVSIIGWLGRH